MNITRVALAAFVSFTVLGSGARQARADLYSLRTSGTISSSSEASLPGGTPFHFELTYDTHAPDLAPGDPTFGSFANSSVPPALVYFHYQAAGYEVTLN